LLDPGHYNNCWIWTKPGYSPNGSNKAYCFVRNKNVVRPSPESKPDKFDQMWDVHDKDMGDDHYHSHEDGHDHHHQNGDRDHHHSEEDDLWQHFV